MIDPGNFELVSQIALETQRDLQASGIDDGLERVHLRTFTALDHQVRGLIPATEPILVEGSNVHRRRPGSPRTVPHHASSSKTTRVSGCFEGMQILRTERTTDDGVAFHNILGYSVLMPDRTAMIVPVEDTSFMTDVESVLAGTPIRGIIDQELARDNPDMIRICRAFSSCMGGLGRPWYWVCRP